MESEQAMETESFLDELKRELDKELPPEELTQMIFLMRDKLGYDFHCEQPSDVVTFLENNMKKSKVISVLKHALAVMKFHGRCGSVPFSKWIEKYQLSHMYMEDENFVGRQKDIALIFEMLNTDRYLGVWIYGFGGLGKTTIAKEIGSRVTRHRDIDFLCVDLKQADTVSDVYRSILRKLNHASHETDNEALLRRVRTVVVEDVKRETWILLDNIEDVYDQNKDAVETFLSSLHEASQSSKVKLLVTSRVSLDMSDACMYQYKLGPLDDESSLRFLRSSCKPAILHGSQYQQALECCGNIPLALVLLSNTVSQRATHGVTDFHLSDIASGQQQTQECIRYAYEKLNDELKKTLIQLTVFDRSRFEVTAVAEVVGIVQEEAICVLMQLSHCDMLQKDDCDMLQKADCDMLQKVDCDMLQKAETQKSDSSAAVVERDESSDVALCYTYFFHELLLRFLQQREVLLPREELSHCQNRFLELVFRRLKHCCEDYYGNSRACVQYIHDKTQLLRTFFKRLNPRFITTLSLTDCQHMQLVTSYIMATECEKLQNIKNIQNMSDKLELRYYMQVQEVAYYTENGIWDEASSIISRIEFDPLLQCLPTQAQRVLKADLNYQKGRLYRRKHAFSNAKDCLQTALVIYEQENSRDPEIVSKHANVLNAFGNVAYNMREFDKALEYHSKAVEVMKLIVGESTHREMSMFKFNLGTISLAKARQIKASDYVSEDDKARAENLMELCLGKMNESITDDVQLDLHVLPEFAEKLQHRSEARLEVKDFRGALNDAEECRKIREKLLNEGNPKRILAHYRIGRIYLKEREHLQTGSTEARTELLQKAKDCFNRVAAYIQDGDLTKDSEGIEMFLKDYERLAKATCVHTYIARVKKLCLRVRAGVKVDSSSESSSSSPEEDLGTASDDSEVNERKDSGVQMDEPGEEAIGTRVKTRESGVEAIYSRVQTKELGLKTRDSAVETRDSFIDDEQLHRAGDDFHGSFQRMSSDEVFRSDDESDVFDCSRDGAQKRKRPSDSD